MLRGRDEGPAPHRRAMAVGGVGREASALEGQARMGSGSIPDTSQLAEWLPAEDAQWNRAFRRLPPWTLADVGLEPQASELEALATAQKAIDLGPASLLRFQFCPRCLCPCTALGQSSLPRTWRSARRLSLHHDRGIGGHTDEDGFADRWPEPDSLGTSLGPGAPSTCL